MRTPQTILHRLVAVTLAVGLCTALAGVVVIQLLEQRDVLRGVEEVNRTTAARKALQLDGQVESVVAQLGLLASAPAVSAMGPNAQAELAVALRVSDVLDELSVHDLTGRPTAAAGASSLRRPQDLPTRDDLAEPPAQPQARFVRNADPPVLEIVVPVEDPPGTAIGTLVARTPVGRLTPPALGRTMSTGEVATLVDGDGAYLSHPDPAKVADAATFPLAEVAATPDGVARIELDGAPTLVAAAPLATLDGWLVVQRAEADVLAPALLDLGEVGLVLLAVVAAMVLTLLVSERRLLRPLGPLVAAVERLERGDRGARAEAAGVGELRVLTDGFNRMAATLEARQEELETAERTARRNAQRLRLMLDAVEDYAIVQLDADGSVRSWNTGARRLLGYPARHALGRSLTSFFDRTGPPRDPLPDAAAHGRGEAEGWCVRADDTNFWARIVTTALRRDDGSLRGFAVVLHDLTDRHAARRALESALERERAAAAALRRTDELKDEFLAMAAHEIRTPLSAILGASAILSQDWEELGEADKATFRDMIETHATDLRGIVDRLLDLTRLQAGRVRLQPEPCHLPTELARHRSLLGQHLEAHDVHVEAADVDVVTDPVALRHIMTNLLSNAAKFSPPGSTILVTATLEGSTLTLTVGDEGDGIPEGELDGVFELFRRVATGPDTPRGTGVGLAIVQRYSELAGGHVRAANRPGAGAVFTVRLPVDRVPTDARPGRRSAE